MQSKWVPKRRLKGLFVMLSLVFVVFLIGVGGVYRWYQANLSPTAAGNEKVLVVQKGETIDELSKRLEENGLIRSSIAFRIYLRVNSKNPLVQAGTFKIKSGLSIEDLLQVLAVGRVDKWITLKEGLRIEEISEQLEKDFAVPKEDFLKLAQEGYMFPDTYLIPIDVNADKAVSILRENFDKRFDSSLREKLLKQKLTLDQAVILASIVERESRSGSERPIIGGILLKRLREGMKLEADATVQYALGYQKDEKTWWKKTLTEADLDNDSPYNTRKFAGLPRGPICSPGLEALEAVVDPKETNYYYYLHDKEGKVHFANTLDEHNANVAKYLQ